MSIEEMKNSSFPKQTVSEWEARCVAALKGKPLSNLETDTYEQIKLKPLYFPSQQETVSQQAGQVDFRRGIFTLEEHLNGDFGVQSSEEVIAYDPLSHLVTNGFLPLTIEEAYQELQKYITSQANVHPNKRTILVNTTPYHNGGANTIQELAISLSTAVTHIEQLRSQVPLSTILTNLLFEFSVGSSFFIEIAKLRAARILWNRVATAYGGNSEEQKMVILARTSHYTKTIFDPYVNLLRAGNEAFAAIVGGAQYLYVSPYTEPFADDTYLSKRIAQNTRVILLEEAYLTKTIDPAGGSWYIEELTDQLVEEAWELFLRMDQKGGLLVVLKSGELQSEIDSIQKLREQAVFTRKQSIIGTNKYVNLEENPPVLKHPNQEKGNLGEQIFKIEPIPQTRLAEAYEELKFRALQLTPKPIIGLLALGELKDYKQRVDFVTGFVAAGGIGTHLQETNATYESLKRTIETSNLAFYCICGSNEEYENLDLALIDKLQARFPNKTFMLAGIPEHQEKWNQAGIKRFISVKSNCYELNSSILLEMEGLSHA